MSTPASSRSDDAFMAVGYTLTDAGMAATDDWWADQQRQRGDA